MTTTLLLVVVLATIASGNITGSNPPSGACLCYTSKSVKVRSAACDETIIGSASSGQCFKYTDFNTRCKLHNISYNFFQIMYNGQLGWSAGAYLSVGSDEKCDAPVVNVTAKRNDYTCQLTDQGRRIHESSSPTPFDCVDLKCWNTCKGGQSVAYVKCRCTKRDEYPPATTAWTPGPKVTLFNGKCKRDIAPTTAIATFSSNGKYNGHAAVFIQCIDDNTVQVYDQWCGRSVGYSNYSLSSSPYSSFAIIRSSSHGPDNPGCRSEISGPTDCPAEIEGCEE